MSILYRLVTLSLACAATCASAASEEWLDLVQAFQADPAPADTQVVVFGTDAARALMGRGWARANEREKGATFSWAVGLRSELRTFAERPEDRVLVAAVKPFLFPESPRQRIELRLNGQSLGAHELAPGRQEMRWAAPRAAWRAGANQLEAVYAYARAPQEVRSSSGDARHLSVAWFELRVEGPALPAARVVSADGESGLLLPFDRPLGFHVEAGESLTLRWSGSGMADTDDRVGLRVQTCDDEGRCAAPVEMVVRPGPQLLALPGGAGPRRVVLQSLWRGDGRPGFDGPVLLESALGPVRVAQEEKRPEPAEAGRAKRWPSANVLVYLVDTLRADRLGAYGYGRPTSPRLDDLARESTVFEQAYANAPWTLPAVTSIMTGLYPWTHGAGDVGKRLDPSAVTLAETLTAEGYDCAAFVTNGVIGPQSGLGAGFSIYRRIPEDPTSESIHARAAVLNAEALSWLDGQQRHSPFFLYMHATDPHAPYRPPAAQRQRFAPSVPPGDVGSSRALDRLHTEKRLDDGRYARPMSDLYDGEVAYVDAAFGDLLGELKRRGILQNTIVIFLADHGEALYEHRVWGHEWWLYQEVIRIPLLIRLPGTAPSGRRSASVVQQVDVLPTILDLVGLSIPDGVQGRSLAPILWGGALPSRPAYSGVAMGRISWAEIDETRKTIVHQHNALADASGDGTDFYDLAADPREMVDRTATIPATVGVRRARVLADVRRHRSHAAVTAPPVDLELLRSLGYAR